MSQVFVIMGVSGCGKTSVGEALAAQLECPFYDADDFHPAENVTKMSNGIPLNDEDRRPWLIRLRNLLADHLAQGQTAVLACSALKHSYRDLLLQAGAGVRFVYLAGSFDLIWERMSAREDHYMKADMLQSQFDTLEPPSPAEAQIIHIDQSVAEIVASVKVENVRSEK